MLDAGQEVVADIVGPFSDEPITESVQVMSGVAILSGRPVGPVLFNGSVFTGVVDRLAGLLTGLASSPANRLATVTYTTGNGVPASVRLATLIIAGHLWETQRGSQPLPMQGAPEELGDPSLYTPGIPPRAKALLQPFMRNRQVA